MLLNNLQQNFVITTDLNWFYPEVVDTWLSVLHRMFLPYNTVEDFINSQISSVNFPGLSASNPAQDIQLYNVQKRIGKAFDQIVSKQLNLTIKTTESYISYFVMRDQYRRFLALGETAKYLYMNPIKICLLNDGGFAMMEYVYKELTPSSISDLNLQYNQTVGNFNTFSMSFTYNYYDVYLVNANGKRELIASDFQPQMDFPQEHLDGASEKYKNMKHKPLSSRIQQMKAEQEQKEQPAYIGTNYDPYDKNTNVLNKRMHINPDILTTTIKKK